MLIKDTSISSEKLKDIDIIQLDKNGEKYLVYVETLEYDDDSGDNIKVKILIKNEESKNGIFEIKNDSFFLDDITSGASSDAKFIFNNLEELQFENYFYFLENIESLIINNDTIFFLGFNDQKKLVYLIVLDH